LLTAVAHPATAEAGQEFYRRYVGVLGEKTGIVVHLTVTPPSGSGGNVTGYYYYAKYRRPISLSGTFDGSRFTLTEGEDQAGHRLQLTVQGESLAGEWTRGDGAKTHSLSAKENYDDAVAFDVLSVEEAHACNPALPGGPGASFSLQWLFPRATMEGERPDAVRQFAMNYVHKPKTAVADESASAAAGVPPCEQVPVRAVPEELARAAAEEYFTEYMQTNAGLESIPLTDKFGVDGNGVTFVYVPYEIASYADGQIELTLSWESLKRYLRDDTAVARLAR
jgi:hypothetical protein